MIGPSPTWPTVKNGQRFLICPPGRKLPKRAKQRNPTATTNKDAALAVSELFNLFRLPAKMGLENYENIKLYLQSILEPAAVSQSFIDVL